MIGRSASGAHAAHRPQNTPHIYVRLKADALWREVHEAARAEALSASSLGALLLAEFVSQPAEKRRSRITKLKADFPEEARPPYRRKAAGDRP